MHTKSSFVFQNLVFHPNSQFCLDCIAQSYALVYGPLISQRWRTMWMFIMKNKQHFEGTFLQYSQLTNISDRYCSINFLLVIFFSQIPYTLCMILLVYISVKLVAMTIAGIKCGLREWEAVHKMWLSTELALPHQTSWCQAQTDA